MWERLGRSKLVKASEEDDKEKDPPYVSAQNSFKQKDNDGCENYSLDPGQKWKANKVKAASVIEARKNTLSPSGKAKVPEQTTKSKDNILILLSQTVSRKVDSYSLLLMAKEKSASVSWDVVFDQCFDFSIDEQTDLKNIMQPMTAPFCLRFLFYSLRVPLEMRKVMFFPFL